MPVYTYILRSQSSGRFYVGITKFKQKRLRQHNRGQSTGTRSRGPWVEIYREEFSDYRSAREREVFLKSGVGRIWIKQTFRAME